MPHNQDALESVVVTEAAVTRIAEATERQQQREYGGTFEKLYVKGAASGLSADRLRRKRKEIEETLLAAQTSPATVLNYNHFPLKINGTLFNEEIPAAKDENTPSRYVISRPRWSTRDEGADEQGVDNYTPIPHLPIQCATEYIREFDEQQGWGGVVIFEGDKDPTRISGRVKVPVRRSDEEGNLKIVLEERDFTQMVKESLERRNRKMLRMIEEGNTWYQSDKTRGNVTSLHRNSGEWAARMKLIPKLPAWVLDTSIASGETVEACSGCGEIPKKSAAICKECAYVFDPLKAYKNAQIEYGHLSMDRMTAEEWEEANAERERRELNKKGNRKKPGN